MKQAKLLRIIKSDKETLGVLITEETNEIFVCKSLELAWKGNQSNISCIPAGEYICKWTRSVHLSQLKGEDVFTYQVFDVPEREGIRIHSANYFTQIQGCVALGSALKDINSDGQLDAVHSGETVAKFAEIMNHEDFKLIIEG